MLSLCMIVKNEEKYLDECLTSVKDIVDEIVLVDTGSEDATIEIAEKHNASVFHYQWCDDFADARNYSLSKANGDWILYLDADERVDAKSIKYLHSLIATKQSKAYECRILNIDEHGKRPSVMKYVRLFPNITGLKFTGKVHEQIEQSLTELNCGILPCEVQILHYGYSLAEEQLKIKAKRNLKILLDELVVNPSGYVQFQIAQTYHILGDEERAVKYFQASLNDDTLRNEYKATALRSVAIQAAETNNYTDALYQIEQSLELDPNQPLSQLAASKIFIKVNRKSEAVNAVKKAHRLNNDLICGKITSLQSILLDEMQIIYQGLNTAIICGNNDIHNYFLQLLKKTSGNNNGKSFYNSYAKMLQASVLSANEIEEIKGKLDNDNIELVVTLLNNYKDKAFVFNLLSAVENKFSNNTFFLNYYGLKAVETRNYSLAEDILNKSINADSNNAATVLFLISTLIQQNKIDNAVRLIAEKKDDFKNQPEVLNKFNVVLQRLMAAM